MSVIVDAFVLFFILVLREIKKNGNNILCEMSHSSF